MGEKLCLAKTHFFCTVFTLKEVGIPCCAVNVVGLVKFLIGGCCADAVCTQYGCVVEQYNTNKTYTLHHVLGGYTDG